MGAGQRISILGLAASSKCGRGNAAAIRKLAFLRRPGVFASTTLAGLARHIARDAIVAWLPLRDIALDSPCIAGETGLARAFALGLLVRVGHIALLRVSVS